MTNIPWKQLSIGLGLAFQFLASLVGAIFLGYVVDTTWDHLAPWGIISGLVGGFSLATYQLLDGLKFLESQDKKRSAHGRGRT